MQVMSGSPQSLLYVQCFPNMSRLAICSSGTHSPTQSSPSGKFSHIVLFVMSQCVSAKMQSASDLHSENMSKTEGVVVVLGGTVVVEVTRTVLTVLVIRVDGEIVVVSTTVDVETGTGMTVVVSTTVDVESGTGSTVVVSIAVDVEIGTEEVLELLELLLEGTVMVEVTKDVGAAAVVSKGQPVRG